MWLVLCDPGDAAALWAYAGLRDRGTDALALVSPQALVCSLRSMHRVDTEGASFEVALLDGRAIDSRKLRGVLNRLSSLPFDHLASAPAAEARYAMEETNALVLSMMAAVSTIALNPPSPRGLGGAFRPPTEWALLAGRAGLPVPAVRISSEQGHVDDVNVARRRGVIALGGKAFGAPLSRDLMQACVRLSQLSETPLIGIDFNEAHDGSLNFAGATVLPDLRLGGSPFLDHLHACLTGVRETRA